jgi:hypothetical protein
LDRNARNFDHRAGVGEENAIRGISIDDCVRLSRARDVHIIRNNQLAQRQQIEARGHGHVVGSRIRVGSVDGLAQRAVGVADTVIGVGCLGDQKRGGEGARREKNQRED